MIENQKGSVYQIKNLKLRNHISLKILIYKIQLVLITVQFKIQMFIESVSQRLSSGIEELARTLNLLHKLKSKQREDYFQKIKSIKDQLISLKTNLKQSNALQTERVYNSLFLSISSITAEVKDQVNIKNNKDSRDADKENRDVNRGMTIRQNSSNYDDALRLIAQKQEEIGQLKLALFEKQELVSMTYEQLRDFKRDNHMLVQQTRMMKVDLNNFERQLSEVNGQLRRKEEEVMDLKLQAQDRQRQLRITIEDLQNCKAEIVTVREQVRYYSQLAEISINKTRIVQENISQVQIAAKFLNENYLSKEADNLHKNKQIQELSLKLRNCQQENVFLKEQNNQLKEDMQVMEEQMIRMQRRLFQERERSKNEKTNLQKQIKEVKFNLSVQGESNQMQKKQIQQAQNKFIEIYGKYQNSERENQEMNRCIAQLTQQSNKKEEQNKSLQNQIRIHEKQLLFCKKQNSILKQQVQKSMKISKDYELQINKLKEIIKIKDIQRLKLNSSIQSYSNQAKSYERDRIIFERSLSSLNEEVKECKVNILKLQQSNKSYRREIDLLKIRLVRAKIEAIHQIRESIRES